VLNTGSPTGDSSSGDGTTANAALLSQDTTTGGSGDSSSANASVLGQNGDTGGNTGTGGDTAGDNGSGDAGGSNGGGGGGGSIAIGGFSAGQAESLNSSDRAQLGERCLYVLRHAKKYEKHHRDVIERCMATWRRISRHAQR
jgi:hypothetical protein